MLTSTLHSEDILLRNENTNIDGNCSKVANPKAIYFNKINFMSIVNALYHRPVFVRLAHSYFSIGLEWRLETLLATD
ncbi:hypothetical protein EDB39_114110 [Vibrio crassostreae]|nr:hypothetical protein EDB39_114110 [Vibrio crassostreae]TCT54142.1 hypothetical protein EDB40_11428 [Vibrio crassostreae]TCT58977.1 hypothetical protein EDB44_118113 [Vibrio crassostreae]TCT80292.1 hypothetical protein EDB43_118113 [Vibrio crassostreae]TCU01570.1 hypothetical protein EDB47_11766 [Vibrio crassostreae]